MGESIRQALPLPLRAAAATTNDYDAPLAAVPPAKEENEQRGYAGPRVDKALEVKGEESRSIISAGIWSSVPRQPPSTPFPLHTCISTVAPRAAASPVAIVTKAVPSS